MNCSSTNLFLNTCLKLDRGYRHNLIKRSCFPLTYASSRIFHISLENPQAQKDNIATLPSPQEVS